MMVRTRRLLADWEGMQQLAAASPYVEFQASGNPPERYLVTYRCAGLFLPDGAVRPALSHFHQVEVYLHHQYPRLQPRLTWLTEIYHPNILPWRKHGGVCIGSWTPAETLAALCLRLAEMVQYKSYNARDPLDLEAAAFAECHHAQFPVDCRPLVPVRPVAPSPTSTVEVML